MQCWSSVLLIHGLLRSFTLTHSNSPRQLNTLTKMISLSIQATAYHSLFTQRHRTTISLCVFDCPNGHVPLWLRRCVRLMAENYIFDDDWNRTDAAAAAVSVRLGKARTWLGLVLASPFQPKWITSADFGLVLVLVQIWFNLTLSEQGAVLGKLLCKAVFWGKVHWSLNREGWRSWWFISEQPLEWVKVFCRWQTLFVGHKSHINCQRQLQLLHYFYLVM